MPLNQRRNLEKWQLQLQQCRTNARKNGQRHRRNQTIQRRTLMRRLVRQYAQAQRRWERLVIHRARLLLRDKRRPDICPEEFTGDRSSKDWGTLGDQCREPGENLQEV
jgi:hypothetical protein